MTKPLNSNQLAADAVPGGPMPTFAELRDAVLAAPDLSKGTRQNLFRAIEIVAKQMSAAGLQGPVDIPKIQRRFEKITAAMLGFQDPDSLSALLS
ncbi:MAG TPA: hypothetical protein VD930_01705, partial [Gemmatimonadales bacterium]|nr:hypothetical protein [Gemmatimonadales bacterium]